MGHGLWQGIDVLAETKATRLDGQTQTFVRTYPKMSAGGKILRVAVRAVGCPLRTHRSGGRDAMNGASTS